VEIGINNISAPPQPSRDFIDNLFWAAIALGILAHATACSYAENRIGAGLSAGFWTGMVSGLTACWTALSLIVFGMGLITRDRINIDEWAARGPGSRAPTMAAYFAFETFTGALMHLVVLGIMMGGILGLLGGLLGRGASLAKTGGKRG
jgi:hypothetical protein